jgi:hypothetical protein
MRSCAARLTIGAVAAIAVGAAAAFLVNSERQLAARATDVRAFDLHARETTDALADLRSAQQAYVAAGQGVTFWMPKVATTTEAVTGAIGALRRSAVSGDARVDLDQAAAAVNDFIEVDTRARDYLQSGQQLMAGDVIFTEGNLAAATAAQHVERARLFEHQGLDAVEGQMRKVEAIALGAAAAISVVALLSLAFARGERARTELAETAGAGTSIDEPVEHARLVPPPSPTSGSIMMAAADFATDVGRVRDLNDLSSLLGRAAELMDAAGVVVWVGSVAGADLNPALAHGYSPQIVARMPAVPRAADNAAAAAYRTGTLQIVMSRPGGSNGAIVAPILTADGCIGAVSAEIRSGGETSETVQALAAIFAAQLANVLVVQEVQEVQEVQKVRTS